jgi:hypothetical protein
MNVEAIGRALSYHVVLPINYAAAEAANIAPVKIRMRSLRYVVSLAVLAAIGCAEPPPKEPLPITPQSESGGAVVRRELPQNVPLTSAAPAAPSAPLPPTAAAIQQDRVATAPVAPAVPPQPPAPSLAEPPVVVPPNLLYVCVTKVNGVRKQVGIEYVPKVHDLCKKHPEMGPCQYERDLCRASGGRVYAANGQEITMAIEEEYDKKVMRVRFRAN